MVNLSAFEELLNVFIDVKAQMDYLEAASLRSRKHLATYTAMANYLDDLSRRMDKELDRVVEDGVRNQKESCADISLDADYDEFKDTTMMEQY